jgi:hypothetical protein
MHHCRIFAGVTYVSFKFVEFEEEPSMPGQGFLNHCKEKESYRQGILKMVGEDKRIGRIGHWLADMEVGMHWGIREATTGIGQATHACLHCVHGVTMPHTHRTNYMTCMHRQVTVEGIHFQKCITEAIWHKQVKLDQSAKIHFKTELINALSRHGWCGACVAGGWVHACGLVHHDVGVVCC